MAAQLGGEVASPDMHVYGYAQVRAWGHAQLLKDIEDHTSKEGYGLLDLWMSHGGRVTPAKRGKGRSRPEGEGKTPEQHHRAMTRAQRLKRVFNIPQGTLS